jgi:hypothetical protein
MQMVQKSSDPMDFIEAVKNGDIIEIENLYKSKIYDIEYKSGVTGNTALCWAVEHKHLNVTNFLLENDANIDVQNSSGLTPLHIAIMKDFTDIAQNLISRGANLNITSNLGMTALIKSCHRNQPVLVESFLSAGRETDDMGQKRLNIDVATINRMNKPKTCLQYGAKNDSIMMVFHKNIKHYPQIDVFFNSNHSRVRRFKKSYSELFDSYVSESLSSESSSSNSSSPREKTTSPATSLRRRLPTKEAEDDRGDYSQLRTSLGDDHLKKR